MWSLLTTLGHKLNKSLISSNHPHPDLLAHQVTQEEILSGATLQAVAPDDYLPENLCVLTSLGLQKQELGMLS